MNFVVLYVHSLIYLFIHSFIYSLSHTFIHVHLYLFLCGSKWWTHVSFPVTISDRKHICFNILRHQILLFTLPLDTEISVSSFFVLCQSFQIISSTHWSNAWLPAVVDCSEQHASVSSAWPFSEPAVHEAERLTVLSSTAVTLWIFSTTCEF